MQVGIIGGTGAEGRGIALRLASAGVRVIVGSRDERRARETVAALLAAHGALPLEAGTNERAVDQADAVCLCVPFAHVEPTIGAHRAAFRAGALVIDVTVPVAFEEGRPRLVEVPEGSAAEHVRRLLPDDVQVAAAFKTLPAAVLGRLDAPLDCDELVCGDSSEARARTMALLRLIPGLRPIDAGALDAARAIERLTWLAIRLNKQHRVTGARFRIVGL